jgi:MFS family permease
MAALGLTINCFSLFVRDWSTEFHTPVSALALGVMIFGLACSVFVVPAALAVDKFPVRLVFGLGLIAVAILHGAVASVSAGWQIIAIYSLLFPAAITFSSGVPAQAIVSRWFVRRRGTAMGLTAFGLAVAAVVFPPVITHLMPTLGWRGVWWLFAALIGLGVMPTTVLMLRDRPMPEEAASYIPRSSQSSVAPATSLKQVLSRGRFWAIVAVFLSVQSVSATLALCLAPIALSRDLTLQNAGVLLSVYAVSALTGKLISGLVVDRIGTRIPFAGVAALAAAGAALLGMAQTVPHFTAAMILIGLSQGHWTILPSSIAAEFGQGGFARAYGAICAATPVGTLAPTLVSWWYEQSATYTISLFILGGVALAGAATALAALNEREPNAREIAELAKANV